MMEVNQEILPRALANLDGMSFTLSPAGPGSERLPSLWLGVGQPPEDSQATYQATISREQAAAIVGYLAGDGLFYRSWQNRAARPGLPEGAYYDVRVGGDQWAGEDVLSLTPVEVTHTESYLERDTGKLTSMAERWSFALRGIMGNQAGQTLDSFIGELIDGCNPEAQSALPTRLMPANTESVESLLSNLATFKAEFDRQGTQDEIYRSLRLSVAPPDEFGPSVLTAQLTPIQAAALAGYLRGLRFETVWAHLSAHWDVPAELYYFVHVSGEGWAIQYENTVISFRSSGRDYPPPGLSVQTLEFLMYHRGGLVGEAGEAMDELLKPILQEQ